MSGDTEEVPRKYLQKLQEFVGGVRLPFLDVAYEPIPLSEILVEPQRETSIQDHSEKARHKSRLSSFLEKVNLRAQEISPPAEAAQAIKRPELATGALAHDRCVFLGEPGQGKSTLLRQYAFQLATHGDPVIFVELGVRRSWTTDSADNFEWIRERIPEVLKAALGQTGWRTCRSLIHSGRAVLLLDGLDELNDEARAQVIALVNAMEKNRVVLSCRPHAYKQERLRQAKVYLLRELQTQQVERLAESTCTALAHQFEMRAENAIAKVQQVASGEMAPMMRNPLFLSFICLTAVKHESEKKIEKFPTGPSALIGECVEALIEWHRKQKVLSSWPKDVRSGAVNRILGKLALQSFKDGSGTIRDEEVDKLPPLDRNLFHEHLLPARFVEERDGDYVFTLETFREYFAARAAAASPDPFAELRPYLHRREWQRVVLYTVGSLEDGNAAWIDLTFPRLVWFFVKFTRPILRIAFKRAHLEAVSEVVDDAARQGKRGLEGWLERSRHTTEYFVVSIWKHHCLWRWQCYERYIFRDLRLAAACVGSAEQRCSARLATSLANRLLALTREQSGVFSASLAEAGRHPLVRQSWLEWSGEPVTEAKRGRLLIQLLRIASFPILLIMSPFLPLTPPARRRERQWRARMALTSVASHLDVCQKLLDLSRDPLWAEKAIGGLTNVATKPHVTARLLELTFRENSPVAGQDYEKADIEQAAGIRRMAVRALTAATTTAPEVRSRLLDLTQDTDTEIRKEASMALAGAAGSPAVRARLLDMTRDPEKEVREAAVTALGSAPPHGETLERLCDILRGEDWTVSWAAEKLLNSFPHDQQTLRLLLQFSHNDNPKIRTQMGAALGRSARVPEVKMRLLEMTFDTNEEVGQSAMESLAGVADESEVRARIIECLGQMRFVPEELRKAASQAELQAKLMELTRDADQNVRTSAAAALGGAATQQAVWLRLIELTHDPESLWVRKTAASSLKNAVGEPAVKRRLLELTHRVKVQEGVPRRLRGRLSNASVREAAVNSLIGALPDSEVRKRISQMVWAPKWEAGQGFLPNLCLTLAFLFVMVDLALQWGPVRKISTAEWMTRFRTAVAWIDRHVGSGTLIVIVIMCFLIPWLLRQLVRWALDVQKDDKLNPGVLQSWSGPVPSTVLSAARRKFFWFSEHIDLLDTLLQLREE